MAQIPENPNALLTRDETASALTAAGFPVGPKALATKATRGGGHLAGIDLDSCLHEDDALAK